MCTACGEPLDQVLIDAGFTDHGEDPRASDGPGGYSDEQRF